VPADLADVVHRMLRRAPEDRFASMREIERALAPFASDEDVTWSALLAAPSRRAEMGRRASPADSATADALGISHTLADQPPKRRRRSRARRMAVLGVSLGVATVGALVLWRVAQARHEPVPEVEAGVMRERPTGTTAPAVESDGTPSRAVLRVVPADAVVRVNGVLASTPGGMLALEGEPGDQWDVSVEHAGSVTQHKVVLSKLGTLSPDRIDLEGSGPGNEPSESATRDRSPASDGVRASGIEPTGPGASPLAAPALAHAEPTGAARVPRSRTPGPAGSPAKAGAELAPVEDW
jgi:hypothetical protein